MNIETFKMNNPHCKIYEDEKEEVKYLVINDPWGAESNSLSFALTDIDKIEDLNNLVFPPQFDALMHIDINEVEFFYEYALPDNDIINRSFSFVFQGNNYDLCFKSPTERALRIARAYQRINRATHYNKKVPQLLEFKDAQRLDDLPSSARRYFSNRIPQNFFLHAVEPIQTIDLETLCRHINLLLRYYDRNSPTIVVRENDSLITETDCKNKRLVEGSFPTKLKIDRIDDIILRLIEVARETGSPRFAYIYYYQVFEYAGFYYIDDKIKRDLKKIIMDPMIHNNTDEKLEGIFQIFTDKKQTDDYKMKKILEDYCSPDVLWREIENDKDFFSKKITFDGGLELAPLITNDMSFQTWENNWAQKLYDNLTKIRNNIVHAREARHSISILPTKKNNQLIEHYLHIIARTAEQIAIFTR